MSNSDAPYTLEKNRGYSVLCLFSKLNEVQWGDVQQVGNEIIPDLDAIKSPALLVDLSNLDYMGSSMVALLVRLWKAVQTKDGQMVVQSEEKMVTEVLSIAGLNSLWVVVATREEALHALKKSPAGSSAAAGSWVGPIIALIAAVGASWILSEIKAGQPPFHDAQKSLYLLLALSAVAVIVGAITVVRNSSIPRMLGGIALLAGLGIAVMGFMAKPKNKAPAPAQPGAPAQVDKRRNATPPEPRSRPAGKRGDDPEDAD